jgi:hypothetical protein
MQLYVDQSQFKTLFFHQELTNSEEQSDKTRHVIWRARIPNLPLQLTEATLDGVLQAEKSWKIQIANREI